MPEVDDALRDALWELNERAKLLKWTPAEAVEEFKRILADHAVVVITRQAAVAALHRTWRITPGRWHDEHSCMADRLWQEMTR